MTPACQRASLTTGRIFWLGARLAISGYTPPNFLWSKTWLATTDESGVMCLGYASSFAPLELRKDFAAATLNSKTAAAVSSQLVSIAKSLSIFFIERIIHLVSDSRPAKLK